MHKHVSNNLPEMKEGGIRVEDSEHAVGQWKDHGPHEPYRV